MLKTDPQLKRLFSTNTHSDTLRIIVFTLAEQPLSTQSDYLFAFPVQAVLKAITCPPINWVADSGIGMTDFGSQNVTVVDLRQQFLFSNSKKQEARNSEPVAAPHRFLILLKTQTQELCGIPVADPPTLTDIPLSTIRTVPLSYRQVAGLSWATHMAILSETPEKKPVKVFLIGMSKIILRACTSSDKK
ncbi:MAG: hypothetical protein QNJ32_27870 [Xenococcaceae cyanobacterium MO_167.B27]|nr:hypothetical protein [Xenococcaceae cyanobacterium MO_167.B27]